VGEILFVDDFSDPEPWTVPQTDRGQISVGGGELNIIIYEPKTFLIGSREKPDLQNFYAEISANPILCSAEDEYGFLFKVIGREQYYRFALTCGGFVRLDTIIGEGGSILYPWTRSGSLPAGAPSKSKLAVLVDGDQISLFINGDRQLTVTDQQLTVGSFGVYARSVNDSAVTVSFSNLIIREVLSK
jgi:hypothetical protein